MPLLICCLYIVGHASLYFITLRNRAALSSERGIFLYHLVSAMVVSVGFFVWAVSAGGADAGADAWAWFAAAVMLHGIYSLSFLELWALADDSYSLAMLQAINRGRAEHGEALAQALETIGTRKQSSRLDNLERAGLVREVNDGALTLTNAGRMVHSIGRGLLVLVNIRKYG